MVPCWEWGAHTRVPTRTRVHTHAHAPPHPLSSANPAQASHTGSGAHGGTSRAHAWWIRALRGGRGRGTLQVLHTDVADLPDELLALEPVPLLSSHGARAAGRGGGRRAARGGRLARGWWAGEGPAPPRADGLAGGRGRRSGAPGARSLPGGGGGPGREGRGRGGAGGAGLRTVLFFFFPFFSSPTRRVGVGWIVWSQTHNDEAQGGRSP